MATREDPNLFPAGEEPLDFSPQHQHTPDPDPHTPTPAAFTQVRGVPTFSGRDAKIGVDDWIRDISYFLTATRTPAQLEFPTIVRNLSGEARRLVLNLPPEEQTPRGAFQELREEYGDTSAVDPFAAFYARVQRNGESAQSFAIALESLLRKIEIEHPHAVAPYQRDGVLATQFTKGLKDEELRLRLAPMRPRNMAFRDVREEVRLIMRERQARGRRPAGAFPLNPGPATPPPDTQAQLHQISRTSEDVLKLVRGISDKQDITERKLSSLEERVVALENTRKAGPALQPSRQESRCWQCGQPGHWRSNCPMGQPPNRRDVTNGRMDALHQASSLNWEGPRRV